MKSELAKHNLYFLIWEDEDGRDQDLFVTASTPEEARQMAAREFDLARSPSLVSLMSMRVFRVPDDLSRKQVWNWDMLASFVEEK